jgi:hypothetical protein
VFDDSWHQAAARNRREPDTRCAEQRTPKLKLANCSPVSVTKKLSMAKFTLYAYVDDSDLHDVSAHLIVRFNAFIERRVWMSPRVLFVNQVRDLEEDANPEFLPDWELGLNIDLPERNQEHPRWFEDVQAIVSFLGELHEETGRDFVVGVGDNETGFDEDYMFVDTTHPDAEELREMFGTTLNL